MELNSLCLQANVFQFNEKLYKQIKVLPMGSWASVVLAEMKMKHIEKYINADSSYNLKV